MKRSDHIFRDSCFAWAMVFMAACGQYGQPGSRLRRPLKGAAVQTTQSEKTSSGEDPSDKRSGKETDARESTGVIDGAMEDMKDASLDDGIGAVEKGMEKDGIEKLKWACRRMCGRPLRALFIRKGGIGGFVEGQAEKKHGEGYGPAEKG